MSTVAIKQQVLYNQKKRPYGRSGKGWPVRVIKAREEERRRGMACIDGEEIEVSDLDITPHLEYGKILKLEIDLLS